MQHLVMVIWRMIMSNPGIYSGIYKQVQELAELVDEVIIRLKENNSFKNDANRQKLSHILANLEPNKWDNLSTGLISIKLTGEDLDNHPDWSRIGKVLSSDKSNQIIVDELESVAQILEQMQSDTLAKMRGVSR